MLFAISGSQGSGKTSVINTIKDMGYPVVERKTSRSILEEWDVTLDQVNNDYDLLLPFQDEILARKIQDEEEATKDISRIWFTERTYADLFTYALISAGKNNKYSNWISEYFEKCCAAQKAYNANFYLPSGRFAVEHDNVRGSNPYYSRMVDRVMKDVLIQMNHRLGINRDTLNSEGVVTVEVDKVDIKARAKQILGYVSQYI